MSNISELLVKAGELMLTGMVFVFLFLSLLVFLVSAMARWLPQEEPQEANVPTSAKRTGAQGGVSPSVVAAISAAVKQHRERNL
uniref:oxaloacetate decarboxylase subunit gamma n=1 Tax=Thaumasiovibrio occultus TaxID=1891184 RepID=UPI000B352D8F|nr:oxaloacetate decarboxylase subunit gamma [Thaumasiovibrio occultus]